MKITIEFDPNNDPEKAAVERILAADDMHYVLDDFRNFMMRTEVSEWIRDEFTAYLDDNGIDLGHLRGDVDCEVIRKEVIKPEDAIEALRVALALCITSEGACGRRKLVWAKKRMDEINRIVQAAIHEKEI